MPAANKITLEHHYLLNKLHGTIWILGGNHKSCSLAAIAQKLGAKPSRFTPSRVEYKR